MRCKPGEDHLFGDLLNRKRHIHIGLRNFRFGLPPGDTKKLFPFSFVRHFQARGKVKVGHIQRIEPSGRMSTNSSMVFFVIGGALRVGVAVRGEPHQFVFPAVDRKSGVKGESGVEQANGMRKVKLLQDFDIFSPAPADRGGGPLSYAVYSQDGGFRKRRRVESAGCVGEMMLRKIGRDFPSPSWAITGPASAA